MKPSGEAPFPWVVPSELTEISQADTSLTRENRFLKMGIKSAGLRSIPAGSILLTSRAYRRHGASMLCPSLRGRGFKSGGSRHGADALWLYYCVSNRRGELQRRAAGSTFREVSRDSVRSLPILLPPLSEQRAIADVLDAIDEAIERTEAVIDATERLRDALLHDLLTRGVPAGTRSGGRSPASAPCRRRGTSCGWGKVAKILSGAAFSSSLFFFQRRAPLDS